MRLPLATLLLVAALAGASLATGAAQAAVPPACQPSSVLITVINCTTYAILYMDTATAYVIASGDALVVYVITYAQDLGEYVVGLFTCVDCSPVRIAERLVVLIVDQAATTASDARELMLWAQCVILAPSCGPMPTPEMPDVPPVEAPLPGAPPLSLPPPLP